MGKEKKKRIKNVTSNILSKLRPSFLKYSNSVPTRGSPLGPGTSSKVFNMVISSFAIGAGVSIFFKTVSTVWNAFRNGHCKISKEYPSLIS